jgi:hypothetical protein
VADAIRTRSRAVWLLAATPIVLLLTHYAAVLPHEFCHSIVAWFVGIKPVPGDISWGPGNALNILLLVDIDENVDYSDALEAGRRWQVALVAFAGPIIANGGLYLITRRLITLQYFASRPYIAYVLFWFVVMNAANLFCYIPIRVFASDGDVHHFLLATQISPWWVYAVGGYLVLWAMIDLYRIPLPWVLGTCGFTGRTERALVLILTTALTFGYFAVPGLLEDDIASVLIARTSLLAIPVIVLLAWQRMVGSGKNLHPVERAPEPHSTASPGKVVRSR